MNTSNKSGVLVSKAKLASIKMSERKIRVLAKRLIGNKATSMISVLSVQKVKSAFFLLKVLSSALSNAVSNGIDKEKLYVQSISVDKAKLSKRVFPRSQGRVNYIKKRTSCITMYLEKI